jgi:hypothetical protein
VSLGNSRALGNRDHQATTTQASQMVRQVLPRRRGLLAVAAITLAVGAVGFATTSGGAG